MDMDMGMKRGHECVPTLVYVWHVHAHVHACVHVHVHVHVADLSMDLITIETIRVGGADVEQA